MPALQVLLGGGVDVNGDGRTAEKVIKVPSRRGPEVLRTVLADYDEKGNEGEYFKDYYVRQGKNYFYELLKPLAQLDDVRDFDFIDWGREEQFKVVTAVGECAGVVIDLVQTLLFDAEEKYDWAVQALKEGRYADSIYHSYNVFINGAKAMLLSEKSKNNTHMTILNDFDKFFVETGAFDFPGTTFRDHVLEMNQHEPSEAYAKTYNQLASDFIQKIKLVREAQEVNVS